MKETLYHVTLLSNFARGFDKYARVFSKSGIPESTFPDRFFLLRRDELGIGVDKASALLNRLAIEGDRLIALETDEETESLKPNAANGRGRFVSRNRISLKGVYEVKSNNQSATDLKVMGVEDAMAASLRLLKPKLMNYSDIVPRAVSFLPVALACQASCPFCFSKASVSSDQVAAEPNVERAQRWVNLAKARGAERAVITGGGEPTLLEHSKLLELITIISYAFKKVVLITNGHRLANVGELVTGLKSLSDAGLSVLALSRHHYDPSQNQRIMGLDTKTDKLIEAWRNQRELWPRLQVRLVCVLQNSGVDDRANLENYVSWAAGLGVEEICFKELYVSTSAESVYHERGANEWSRAHQIPLSLVTDFCEEAGFSVEHRLPWGAPIYHGRWQGKAMRIAAYTEPSLFWERTRGIARSWNVMADGTCLASLEDRASVINLEGVG